MSWKTIAHSRLKQLQDSPLFALQKLWPEPAERSLIDKDLFADHLISPYYLVFVDGFFEPALSQLPKGLVCMPLSAAFKSYGLFLHNRLNQRFREECDPLVLLNALHESEGVFLYAPEQFHCETILQIHCVFTKKQLAAPRVQATIGRKAALSFVQTVQTLDPCIICNSSVDLVLEKDARVQWVDLALLPAQAQFFCSASATVKTAAHLEIFRATSGAQQMRISDRIELVEPQSFALLRHLGMLHAERQAQIQTHVEHKAYDCTSRQEIKIALNGNSRSCFEGKIYVHPEAQKTNSYQSCRNLLLSDAANASAKPNLEIFADDVKASHGATFSTLSEDELLYLRARGIGVVEAKQLLVEGFCRSLIDSIDRMQLRRPLLLAMQRMLQ